MTRTSSPKILMKGVVKRFGPKTVLDGLDLDVMPGESVVIIGGSGTGKSVTIKCLLGLLTPDEGEILIDGKSVVGLSEGRREKVNAKIGMLFQHAALFDSMPVWENVAFGLIQGKGMSRNAARDKAMEKLAQVGLSEEVGSVWPAELSGGMRKRVGLARAIAIDPEIILFDEPTTGIDPIMGDIINKLIAKVTREIGATGITITHDMSSARAISDRVAMIYKGKVVWQGETEAIDQTGNEYVDQFIHGRIEGPIKMEIRRL